MTKPYELRYRFGTRLLRFFIVQIVAYSQKSYAVRGALKLKQELYPIPVFIDQPKTDVFYVLTGPFNSSDKATISKNQQKGLYKFCA